MIKIGYYEIPPVEGTSNFLLFFYQTIKFHNTYIGHYKTHLRAKSFINKIYLFNFI